MGRPGAPALRSGVRKKRASETYWKINVSLVTNDDLEPLRVQNRRGEIQFSEPALCPPRAGAGFMKNNARAQRGENFYFEGVWCKSRSERRRVQASNEEASQTHPTCEWLLFIPSRAVRYSISAVLFRFNSSMEQGPGWNK